MYTRTRLSLLGLRLEGAEWHRTVPLQTSLLSEQTDGPTSTTGDLQGTVQASRELGLTWVLSVCSLKREGCRGSSDFAPAPIPLTPKDASASEQNNKRFPRRGSITGGQDGQ